MLSIRRRFSFHDFPLMRHYLPPLRSSLLMSPLRRFSLITPRAAADDAATMPPPDALYAAGAASLMRVMPPLITLRARFCSAFAYAAKQTRRYAMACVLPADAAATPCRCTCYVFHTLMLRWRLRYVALIARYVDAALYYMLIRAPISAI